MRRAINFLTYRPRLPSVLCMVVLGGVTTPGLFADNYANALIVGAQGALTETVNGTDCGFPINRTVQYQDSVPLVFFLYGPTFPLVKDTTTGQWTPVSQTYSRPSTLDIGGVQSTYTLTLDSTGNLTIGEAGGGTSSGGTYTVNSIQTINLNTGTYSLNRDYSESFPNYVGCTGAADQSYSFHAVDTGTAVLPITLVPVALITVTELDGSPLPTDGSGNPIINPAVPAFLDVPDGIKPGVAMVTATGQEGAAVNIIVAAVTGSEGHTHLVSSDLTDIDISYNDKAGTLHQIPPILSAENDCDPESPPASQTTQVQGTIANGKFITYICAGELAVDLRLTAIIGGMTVPSQILRVRLNNLAPLTQLSVGTASIILNGESLEVPTNAFSAEGNGPLSNGVSSHPGDGFAGLPFLNQLLQTAAVSVYVDDFLESSLSGNPPCNLLPLNLQAISLSGGGVDDIEKDFNPPHWRHRAGNSADIGLTGITPVCRKILEAGLRTAQNGAVNIFPVTGEDPAYPTATHWHLQVTIDSNFNPKAIRPTTTSKILTKRDSGAITVSTPVSAAVTSATAGQYSYSYAVTNNQTLPMEVLQLFFSGSGTAPTWPTGWAPTVGGQGEAWAAIAVTSLPDGYVDNASNVPSTASVAPGAQLSGFSIQGALPPTISTFNIGLYAPIPVFGSEEDLPVTPVSVNTLVQGSTIAPSGPLNNDPAQLMANLINLEQQAANLGWIDSTDNSVVGQQLTAISQALASGNTGETGTLLQGLMTTVQQDNGVHLTSEGYALMYFNAQYMLETIKKRRGQLISQ